MSKDKEESIERGEETHHMYSAMILSVVSERLRLMRSVREAIAGSLERCKYRGGMSDGKCKGINGFYTEVWNLI